MTVMTAMTANPGYSEIAVTAVITVTKTNKEDKK